MASPAQESPRLGLSASVRSVVVSPRRGAVERPVERRVTAPRGAATIVREKAAVPRARSVPVPLALPPRPPKADIREVGDPSQWPHAAQNARWSALLCAQCLQVRIAVESLLYPWYRFGYERRRQDELPAHRKDLAQEPRVQEGRRGPLRRQAGIIDRDDQRHRLEPRPRRGPLRRPAGQGGD